MYAFNNKRRHLVQICSINHQRWELWSNVFARWWYFTCCHFYLVRGPLVMFGNDPVRTAAGSVETWHQECAEQADWRTDRDSNVMEAKQWHLHSRRLPSNRDLGVPRPDTDDISLWFTLCVTSLCLTPSNRPDVTHKRTNRQRFSHFHALVGGMSNTYLFIWAGLTLFPRCWVTSQIFLASLAHVSHTRLCEKQIHNQRMLPPRVAAPHHSQGHVPFDMHFASEACAWFPNVLWREIFLALERQTEHFGVSIIGTSC